jgi:hypothetical protein
MYVAVVAIAVAVISIGLGLYLFRAGRKRTQLRYDIVVERVFAPGSAAKITIDDKPVAEPHEVRLWFQPTGNRDVTSSAFDEGELALTLGAPLATPPTSGDTDFHAVGSPGDERIVVPRQLLKCGSLVYASMIVDGEPSPALHGGLADVDLVEFDVADAGRQSLAGVLRSNPNTVFTVGSVLVAIVGGLFGMFAAGYETDEERAADVARAVAETMAVSPASADNPVLVEMIRRAVNDALAARGHP